MLNTILFRDTRVLKSGRCILPPNTENGSVSASFAFRLLTLLPLCSRTLRRVCQLICHTLLRRCIKCDMDDCIMDTLSK